MTFFVNICRSFFSWDVFYNIERKHCLNVEVLHFIIVSPKKNPSQTICMFCNVLSSFYFFKSLKSLICLKCLHFKDQNWSNIWVMKSRFFNKWCKKIWLKIINSKVRHKSLQTYILKKRTNINIFFQPSASAKKALLGKIAWSKWWNDEVVYAFKRSL